MQIISIQVALFGEYNGGFDNLYNRIKAAVGDQQIATYNIDGMLDSAPGVPRELPRLEIHLKDGVRFSAARNRFDIHGPSDSLVMQHLETIFTSLQYNDIRRIGFIATSFISTDIKTIFSKVEQAFSQINKDHVNEFAVRINEQDNLQLQDNSPLLINFVRQFYNGDFGGTSGFICMDDINNRADQPYEFHTASIVKAFIAAAFEKMKATRIF